MYEGGQLLQMLYNHLYFEFFYDANGNPVSMTYRMSPTATPTYYYYGTNSRGDIIALYDSEGTQVASYSYDAYGKPMETTELVEGNHVAIAVNPLRYRGYVYDNETDFYYLQSRYYDPSICYWIEGVVL